MFGKYNEKTYKKNTVLFKNQLQKIIERQGIPYDVGRILNAAMRDFELSEIPEIWDAKELEKIDSRITGYISKMYDDMQQKSFLRMSSHADMLRSTVCSSRAFGKSDKNDDIINMEEQAGELYARIGDALQKITDLDDQMKKIQDEGDEIADDNDPRLRSLMMQHKRLRAEKDRYDNEVEECTQEYNETLRILEVEYDDVVLDSLPDKPSPQEFQKHVAKLNAKRAERQFKRQARKEAYEEYANTKKEYRQECGMSDDDEFMKNRKARQQVKAETDIDNAEVKQTTDASKQKPLNRWGN